ncbi:metallophosphoesterase family protein [Treponema sp.]|uniref:metallophosphoesterase family protein n=1 Tax=Treponema sp. TaxID=166 RepID=UPI00388E4B71
MKLLILSDIHGNLAAVQAVLDYLNDRQVDCLALLGDLIDYCPHSNEVLEIIANLKIPVICNIWGNHEDAIIYDHYERFTVSRAIESSKYTKSTLSSESFNYLNTQMEKKGWQKFLLDGKKYLAVHGTIEDIWRGQFDVKTDLSLYLDYDVVLMGHSHRPIFYEAFFKCEDEKTRNQKKIIFINPGSVGQPRNLNFHSQFAIFDTVLQTCELIKVPYDIKLEQEAFSDKLDPFYKKRLEMGV